MGSGGHQEGVSPPGGRDGRYRATSAEPPIVGAQPRGTPQSSGTGWLQRLARPGLDFVAYYCEAPESERSR